MNASTQWQRLVRARLAEMERLEPGRGSVGARYWNAARARRFASGVGSPARQDPLLRRLRAEVSRTSSVLDVGAGTGRYSLAIAPKVAAVTAVDPSPAMLNVLDRNARGAGITNIDRVIGRWEEVDVPRADVSVCSFVLPLIENAGPFLEKLGGSTRKRAFLYMNAASVDLLVDPLWRHFHERPRKPSPTYMDAVAVLAELEVTAEVEVAEVPSRVRFPSLQAAVKAYRDQLLLPDSAAVRAELRVLLRSWLIEDREVLRPPLPMWPVAIVSWRPRAMSGAKSN